MHKIDMKYIGSGSGFGTGSGYGDTIMFKQKAINNAAI